MAEQTILDLDAMLDSSLDAIPEAPDYDNPPDGTYMLLLKEAGIDSYKTKDDEEKRRIKLTYAVAATIETKDMPVADGTLFTETFQATDQGLSYFKKQAKNVLNVASLDGVPMRDIFNTLAGTEFKALITSRVTKATDGSGREFTNLRIRPLHDEE